MNLLTIPGRLLATQDKATETRARELYETSHPSSIRFDHMCAGFLGLGAVV